MSDFQLVTRFEPAGDQPEAIRQMIEGIEAGLSHQTLLGVTGSGKTFSIANVIAHVNRPTLVLAELALHPVGEGIFQFGYANADGGVIHRVSGVAAKTRVNAVVAFQLFARAGAGIGQAHAEQAVEYFSVGLVPFALTDQLAVPFKTIALKGIENRRLGTHKN